MGESNKNWPKFTPKSKDKNVFKIKMYIIIFLFKIYFSQKKFSFLALFYLNLLLYNNFTISFYK